MNLKIKKDYLLIAFDLWWMLFVLLVNTGFNAFGLLTIVGFISLVCIPGGLTLLALRLRLPAWGYIILAMAFSLLELIVFGLISNGVLPLFGIMRPLDNPYLLGTISVGV